MGFGHDSNNANGLRRFETLPKSAGNRAGAAPSGEAWRLNGVQVPNAAYW
jgi:hypothetical protein